MFDELAAGGGRTVEMPFWKDLTATRQLLSDSASLTVNKITADKDIARIHNDAQASATSPCGLAPGRASPSAGGGLCTDTGARGV